MIMYIQYIYIDIHYVSAIFTWKYISNDKPLVSKPTDLGNILTWSWNIWRSNLQPGRHLRLNCLPLSLWQERGLGKPTTQKTFWGFGKKKRCKKTLRRLKLAGRKVLFWFWLLVFVVWSVRSNFCSSVLSSVWFSSGEKQYLFIFMIIQVPKYLLSRPWLLAKMNLWDPTDPSNLLFYRVDPSNWVAHFPIQGNYVDKKQTDTQTWIHPKYVAVLAS